MINKIQVGSKTYSVGGGVAKLVARGEWDSEYYSAFVLNKDLEIGKIYYIVIDDEENGYRYNALVCYYSYEGEPPTTPFIYFNMDGEQLFGSIIIFIGGDENNQFSIVSIPKDSTISQSGSGKCEVYELPFTLGGNE